MSTSLPKVAIVGGGFAGASQNTGADHSHRPFQPSSPSVASLSGRNFGPDTGPNRFAYSRRSPQTDQHHGDPRRGDQRRSHEKKAVYVSNGFRKNVRSPTTIVNHCGTGQVPAKAEAIPQEARI
jgi:hypothetical protein